MNPEPRFTADEYAARLAKTRAAMEAKGVDCLIVSDPSNMHWLTGYDGWSFYVHQAVVVPPTGDPIWYGRGQDANGAMRTDLSARRRHRRLSRPLRAVDRAPSDGLSSPAHRASAAGDKLPIGVEMDNYWFSAAAFASLQTHLPNARFADATALVNWQRAVKARAEIGYMRKAARIVEAMQQRIADKIARRHAQMRPRRRDPRRRHARQRRVSAAIIRRSCRCCPPARRLGPASHLGRQADAGGRGHLLRDRRLLPPLPLPAVAHRLPRQADRRHSSTPRRRRWKAWRPGSPRRSPATPARTSPTPSSPSSTKHGIVKDNRTGYSIGLSYPPDWGERTMSLRPGDRTELGPA